MSLSGELLRRYALKYVGALVLSSVTWGDHLKEAAMSSLLRRRVCVLLWMGNDRGSGWRESQGTAQEKATTLLQTETRRKRAARGTGGKNRV